MHRHGCQRNDHPALGGELLQVGGMSLFGMGLADLARLESQAADARLPRGVQNPWSLSFNPAVRRSTKPLTRSQMLPKAFAANMARRKRAFRAYTFASTCRNLPPRAHRFSLVRTMHHPADRQFRNEHSSCHY